MTEAELTAIEARLKMATENLTVWQVAATNLVDLRALIVEVRSLREENRLLRGYIEDLEGGPA